MTLDDYYHQAADTDTVHLSTAPGGPALCNYGWDGRGRLVLDTGIDEDAICGNCMAKVR